MPKINLIPQYTGTDDGGTARYKQNVAMANALMEGSPAGAIRSPAQGAVSVAAQVLGGWLARDANQEERAAEAAAWDPLKKIMENSVQDGSPDPTGYTPSGNASAPASGPDFASGGPSGGGAGYVGDEAKSQRNTAASNERAQRAVSFFEERGYTPVAARGIVAHGMHESGLEPVRAVGDNGTAHGVFQWRGPRFENLQRFAAANKSDWRDFDTQLAFADHEMRSGQDRGAALAYQGLQSAKTPDEAVSAFMHFERPQGYTASNPAGGYAYGSRLAYAQRLFGGGAPQGAVPGAPGAVPGAPGAPAPAGVPGAPQYADLKPNDPRLTGQRQSSVPMPPAPDLSQQRQQIQIGQTLMQNPRTRAQGWAMYQGAIKEMNDLKRQYQVDVRTAQTAQRSEDLTRERFGREDSRNSVLDERHELERKEDLKHKAPHTMKVKQPDASEAVLQYDPETDSWRKPKFEESENGVGTGAAVRPANVKVTEAQDKSLIYYNRGAPANVNLNKTDDELTSFWQKKSEGLPGDIGNYFQGERYQLAKRDGAEVLASILRKDTGAAVTPVEFKIYGDMFLPQPGDKPATITAKREARARALEAIKTGMGTAQALAVALPDEFDGSDELPKRMKGAPAAPAPTETGDMPPNISAEDRKLWPHMDEKGRKAIIKLYSEAGSNG